MEGLTESLHQFSAKRITGEEVSLAEICKGKKCTLVVNVAAAWGLTHSNYTELVQLYKELEDKGFQILAFPCNQFGQQEPGSNLEIFEWAKTNYGVTFPMFEKSEVNGDNACPVYQFLRMKSSLYNPET